MSNSGLAPSKLEAGVSGWHDESRGESSESMDIDMGLGKEVVVCVGQTVSAVLAPASVVG